MNIVDVVLLAAVVAAVGLAVAKIVRNRRRGRTACGCDCGRCQCGCGKQGSGMRNGG